MKVQEHRVEKRPTSALETAFLGCRLEEIPKLVPGVALSGAIVVISVLIADSVNTALGVKSLISYIMMAIVLGLIAGTS